MGVRLNKVLTELNIGLQTAIEYLKNKRSLGEIKDDANVNTKISDEQYEALVKEFKRDKDVKTQANMIFPKKEKKDKPKPKPEVFEPKVEIKEELRQEYKPLGKIDLDSLNGKKKEEVKSKEVHSEPELKVEVESKPKPEPEPEVMPEPNPEPKVEVMAEVKTEPKPEPIVEVKAETPVVPVAPEAPESVEIKEEKSTEVFKLKTEQKSAPNLNVVGKIDLDSLNQSTRPKKKSKEERRKEREEKQSQMHSGNGEKKKRERIRGGKERVDIEAAASQDKGQNNSKNKKNKGGNQNFQDSNNGQQSGKKNKKNRPVKPLEVDDEAVARQVKETLARLTSKNQNKKGANCRGSREQDIEADRVCDCVRTRYDDERRRKPGYRYLYEHRYHGIYQSAPRC